MADFEWDTDIGAIWRRVISRYNAANPEHVISPNLTEPLASNTEAMMKVYEKAEGEFKAWRKPRNRTLECLARAKGFSEITVALTTAAGGVAGTFFAPSPAIAQALVYVLQATQKVSEDNDKIEAFFDVMEALFSRLRLLEKRYPKDNAAGLTEQLARVFGKILELCGIARIHAVKGKLALFGKKLFTGASEVTEAYSELQTQLDRLDSAVLMATLGIVTKSNQEMEAIHRDITDGFKGQAAELGGTEKRIINHQAEAALGLLRDLRVKYGYENDPASEKRPSANPDAHAQERDAGDKDAGNRLADSLADLRDRLSTARYEALLEHHLAELAAARLPNTCTWIVSHASFVRFSSFLPSDLSQILIRGAPDTGKSILSEFVFKHLQKRKRLSGPGRVSVAYFRFSADLGQGNLLDVMLNCCAVQIAGQDTKYRKALQTEDPKSFKDRWTAFFARPFAAVAQSTDTTPLLFLVLDGLDVLDQENRSRLDDRLHAAGQAQLRIRVFMTETLTGPENLLDPTVEEKRIVRIDDHIQQDIRTFIQHRIATSSRLRTLRIQDQKDLLVAVFEKSKTFLFASYALRRLNTMGGMHLAHLAKFKTEHGDIYNSLLHESAANRISVEIAQIQCLVAWLTYCEDGYVRLGQARDLLRVVQHWDVFGGGIHGLPRSSVLDASESELGLASAERFDQELEGGLSRIFSIHSAELGASAHDGDDGDDDENPSASSSPDNDLLKFRHPALRDHCKASSVRLQGQVVPVASSAAPWFLFKLYTHLLLAPDSAFLSSGPGGLALRIYAADRWINQLNQLPVPLDDVQEADPPFDKDLATIALDCMYRVLSNEKNSLRHLEGRYFDGIRSVFGKTTKEVDTSKETIRKWFHLSHRVDQLDLGDNARTWIDDLVSQTEPLSVTLPRELAKHHMDNWWVAEFPSLAWSSFIYYEAQLPPHSEGDSPEEEEPSAEQVSDEEKPSAEQASDEEEPSAEQVSDEKEPSAEKVIEVAEAALGARPWPANEAKGVAMALRYNLDHNEALLVLEDAQYDPENKEASFGVHNRLGRIYYGLAEDENDEMEGEGKVKELRGRVLSDANRANLEKALDNIQNALKALNGDHGKATGSGGITRTYQQKAKAEILLGRHAEGLQSLQEAVKIAKSSEPKWEFTTPNFERLVHVLRGDDNVDNETGFTQVVSLVTMLGGAQLALACVPLTHAVVLEAAKKTDRIADVAAVYQSAIDILARRHNRRARTLCIHLADLKLSAGLVSSFRQAKTALYQAFEIITGDVGSITAVGWRLADILLEQFLRGDSLASKERALGEMEQLLDRMRDMQSEFEPQQSQMSIPLSIMRRRLGSAAAFFQGAQSTFDGCIEALNDEIPENDTPSFQVLAKALRLIPGLERDAEVAASCQFYIVDKEVSEDEGFAGNANVSFDCGGCGVSMAWKDDEGVSFPEDRLYMCSYCTGTFLCDTCYGEMSAGLGETQRIDTWPTEDGPEERRPHTVRVRRGKYSCLAEHTHIQMPADKWKGVRKGKMYFEGPGGGEEARDISLWLGELRGRWDQAWKRYWADDPLYGKSQDVRTRRRSL
ncbi:hypothetical protein QBC39DRAFT_101008 [Podospora conica]|nr:hypothetical protein QBC39DRAFT_101008 [Schizothecium conicum]